MPVKSSWFPVGAVLGGHRIGPAGALVLLLALVGCRPSDSAVGTTVAAAAVDDRPKASAPRRSSLPRFEGRRIDGGVAGTELFRHRRGIVYVFSSRDRDADLVAGIVKRLQGPAKASNVAILGVNREIEPAEGRRFVQRHGFEFPVILDDDLSISRKLRIPPAESALVIVDGDGSVLGGFAGLDADVPEPDQVYEREMRRLLHLEDDQAVVPTLGLLPEAPDFEAIALNGAALSLGTLRGKVAVLMLFSPLCPHCHEALRFLQGLVDELSHPDLAIVPVSVMDRRYLLEDMLETQRLRFDLYLDPDSLIRKAYGHAYTVPDTVVITRDGHVLARHEGFSDRIQALLTMEVRRALGVKNVLLLDKVGFSGEETCRVCHAGQHETWSLTAHSAGFETLVEHGAVRDPECLPCHTVGWGQPGGYSLETPEAHLQGIQCENCHGRGGPHQSPDSLKGGFEPVCLECHNPKHSLNFIFAERLPLVSHAANARFMTLSLDERRELLEARDQRARKLFRSARFVGSDRCQSCHAGEHAVWSRSAHAHAFDTLKARGEETNPSCQTCHTTGFQKTGGFPDGGDELVQVGCESCHGPGGEHVEETAPKRGTILALADKCDSCVLLQICGSCHDEANDPGFEFELLDKLEKVRHGMQTVGRVGL